MDEPLDLGFTICGEQFKECGAKCRNAAGPSCDCSCGGKNHAEHGGRF